MVVGVVHELAPRNDMCIACRFYILRHACRKMPLGCVLMTVIEKNPGLFLVHDNSHSLHAICRGPRHKSSIVVTMPMMQSIVLV